MKEQSQSEHPDKELKAPTADADGPQAVRARRTRRSKRRKRKAPRQASAVKAGRPKVGGASDYPRHSVQKALRIPKAILEQNAGRACTDREAARFSGVGYHGPFRVELSSALKYGFLARPTPGHVELTDLARTVLRPQNPADELGGLREAVLKAPKIADVYKHYRGENIPDEPFFSNALADNFGIPVEKQQEFETVFFESLQEAQLLEPHGERRRVIDVSQGAGIAQEAAKSLTRLDKTVSVQQGDGCFVMMPFADPVGAYYKAIYEPAIRKAGLQPIRADDDMFSTGKIIDQIWFGIQKARVLVAELSGRNPNVFYELGLAHALQKPVVLVSSNEGDVPFDVQHIRVIYYNVYDPFWGEKLISKIAENIVSALKNPGEAILKKPPNL